MLVELQRYIKSSMAAKMDEGMEASWKALASNGR